LQLTLLCDLLNQISSQPWSLKPDSRGPVLLSTTCWWPFLARFAQLLAQAGCRVAVLCPPGHPVRAVPGVTVLEQRAFHPTQALSAAIAACQPTLVIPADDRAVTDLHRLHQTGSDAERRLVERSLGSPHGYPVTTSRLRLLALARRLDIPVPDDQAIATPADLDAWIARTPGPWVLKVDGSWAGAGVQIAATRRQAHAAFDALSHQVNGGVALTRMLVNRDPFSAADWLRRKPQQVSAQRHVSGWPGNLAMLCRGGEVLAASVAEAVACGGATGPSTIIRLVDRPEFVEGARRLAHELRLAGCYGLDFMVEEATGRALLIELNPRLTPLSNIRIDAARDLVGAVVAVLTGAACAPPAARPGNGLVAHFPSAWQWHGNDPRLAACFQDVPWDEPALMAEMLRPGWPERPLLARMESGSRRLVRRARARLRARKAAESKLVLEKLPQ